MSKLGSCEEKTHGNQVGARETFRSNFRKIGGNLRLPLNVFQGHGCKGNAR